MYEIHISIINWVELSRDKFLHDKFFKIMDYFILVYRQWNSERCGQTVPCYIRINMIRLLKWQSVFLNHINIDLKRLMDIPMTITWMDRIRVLLNGFSYFNGLKRRLFYVNWPCCSEGSYHILLFWINYQIDFGLSWSGRAVEMESQEKLCDKINMNTVN